MFVKASNVDLTVVVEGVILRMGTPAQTVKVMISTAGSQAWVVLPDGCTSLDPPDCITSRGVFYANRSSTWRKNNVTSNAVSLCGLILIWVLLETMANLVTIRSGPGWQGSVDGQILAEIATKQFFLGVFGLNPRPTSFSNFSDPSPSYDICQT